MIKTYLRLELYKSKKEFVELVDRVDVELHENVNDLLDSFTDIDYAELYLTIVFGHSNIGNFVSSLQRVDNQWALCPRKDEG